MTLTQRELVDAPTAQKPRRLESLDVFRGATIAGMILVNNPGDWGQIYAPLRHAEWHGVTPTDLIFPFFLFIVGVAIPFSFAARRARAGVESNGVLIRRIVVRAALLFGIGLLLHALPSRWPTGEASRNGIFTPDTFRIMGVLQRIALCYLSAAMLALVFNWRGLLASAIVLMAIYTMLMLGVAPPGGERGDLSIEGNLATYIDTKILGAHSYRAIRGTDLYWEPEGFLSTLPAIGTTLLGVLAGLWLRTSRSGMEKAAGLLACGVVAAILGYCLDGLLIPINKGLWTPSYVFYTAGLALLGLGLCYWVIDVHGYRKWSKLLMIFGMNALAMFVAAGIIARVMSLVTWTGDDGRRATLRGFLYAPFKEALEDPKHASLAWAVCYVLLFLLIALVLYRRRIFIKV